MVEVGVGPLSILEGRCHLLDHILDGFGHERGLTGFKPVGVVPSTDLLCKGTEEEDPFGGVKSIEVDVVLEAELRAEAIPPFPSQRVLLVGTLCDSAVTFAFSRMEEILEITLLGILQMQKFGGSWAGQAEWRKDVSSSSDKWKSRDRESQTTLSVPGQCWL